VRPLIYSGRACVVNHCIAAAALVGVVAGLRWPLCEGRVPAVSTAVLQRPRLWALSLNLQRSHRCSAHPLPPGGPVHLPAHRRGRRGWRRPQAPLLLLTRLPVGPPGAPSQATNSSPACRATATAAAVVLHAGGAAGIRYSEGSAGGLGGAPSGRQPGRPLPPASRRRAWRGGHCSSAAALLCAVNLPLCAAWGGSRAFVLGSSTGLLGVP